jgi:hypothetical protein
MSIYNAIRIGILVLNVILVIWVVNDAKKRDAHPVVWGIVVFLFGIIGWIIYLLTRPSYANISGSISQPNGEQSNIEKFQPQVKQKSEVRAGFRHNSGPTIVPDDIFD